MCNQNSTMLSKLNNTEQGSDEHKNNMEIIVEQFGSCLDQYNTAKSGLLSLKQQQLQKKYGSYKDIKAKALKQKQDLKDSQMEYTELARKV